jgi:hypothetical protein
VDLDVGGMNAGRIDAAGAISFCNAGQDRIAVRGEIHCSGQRPPDHSPFIEEKGYALARLAR